MNNLYQTNITSLPFLSRGKVRDNYAIDNDKLLIITTDRLSVFDTVANQLIPNKGKILNQMSNFWFKKLHHIIPNHLTQIQPESIIEPHEVAQVKGRAVVAKKLQPILIEAIVRGYLVGSSWTEYQTHKSICNIQLPNNLQEGEKLIQPIFTPAIKKNAGMHDENISFENFKKYIGTDLAIKIRKTSLQLYKTAVSYAITCGIIIADTKFEFGICKDNVLYLIDEVLTPDSSRFWSTKSYKSGILTPSLDKQFLRNYLTTSTHSKKNMLPLNIPKYIIEQTSIKYQEVFYRLTGHTLKNN